jgi:hypothetical protein
VANAASKSPGLNSMRKRKTEVAYRHGARIVASQLTLVNIGYELQNSV